MRRSQSPGAASFLPGAGAATLVLSFLYIAMDGIKTKLKLLYDKPTNPSPTKLYCTSNEETKTDTQKRIKNRIKLSGLLKLKFSIAV
jgi:hypothetical protein